MPEKNINALKCGFSFLVSSVIRKPVIYGMPPAVSIELTNHCNLKCPECPSGSGLMTRKRGYMDLLLFRSIIGELKPYLLNTNLYFQGEPMLHPQFFNFLETSSGITTTLSTNGHFLSAENSVRLVASGLNRLIISLDGFDQETYSTYRMNGNVDTVKEGIKNISKAVKNNGSKMKVEVQALVNRYNENQTGDISKFVKAEGFSVVLKSMQIYGYTHSGWMPSGKRFRRYEMKNGVYEIRSSLPRRCARLWYNPVITWDGTAVPCCFDKNADYVMGDLRNHSFREIWHGEKFTVFRKRVFTGREQIGICRNCTSGLKL